MNEDGIPSSIFPENDREREAFGEAGKAALIFQHILAHNAVTSAKSIEDMLRSKVELQEEMLSVASSAVRLLGDYVTRISVAGELVSIIQNALTADYADGDPREGLEEIRRRLDHISDIAKEEIWRLRP